ncbi:MAG: Mpo1-like protein [Oceanococcus sp.]
MSEEYRDFEKFYPYYLAEHSNRTCRRLHFLGSSGGLLALAMAIFSLNPAWLLAGLVFGYACAWIGHFYFEHNKPATFQYPWQSFKGDWVMYKDMWTGKIPF